MGTDETQILHYLKQFKTFVSAIEICKRAGGRKRFSGERDWARPVLRRLEADGFIETNEFGQYRLVEEDAKNKKGRRNIYERCQKAISSHALNWTPADDNRPFASLMREAIQSEYTEETSWLSKNE